MLKQITLTLTNEIICCYRFKKLMKKFIILLLISIASILYPVDSNTASAHLFKSARGCHKKAGIGKCFEVERYLHTRCIANKTHKHSMSGEKISCEE